MLARLARVLLVVALLASWQAGLEHPIDHAAGGHEDAAVCGALDALTACAAKAPLLSAKQVFDYATPAYAPGAPRPAQAPPFLSHGPPVSA